jgi:hypothetical protein
LVAWAAGIFEGEGCITSTNGRLTIRVTNTDEWVVRKVSRILGGTVYGPYTSRSRDGFRRKPFWHWVADGEAAEDVLAELEPWLSERRLQRAEQIYTRSRM